MSFKKSKAKESATHTGASTTTVDPWGQQQYTNNVSNLNNSANGILGATQDYNASHPFQSYDAPMVAGMSHEQQQARTMAGNNVNNWQGNLNSAEDATRAAGGYDPGNVSQFFNPFEDSVVQNYSNQVDQNLAKQTAENQSRQTLNGTYGGSRHLGNDTELQRLALSDKANTIANLRYKGYGDAQQVGFQNAQHQLNVGQQYGILGEQRQKLGINDVQMMEQLGALPHEIEQMQLLAKRAEFDRGAAEQLAAYQREMQARHEAAQIQQGILGATPYGSSTNSSGSGQNKSSGTDFGISFVPKTGVQK